jgi:hypothetical protein
VRVLPLDMTQPPAEWDTAYDLVVSHFGALNCVPNLPPLAAWLADHVVTGGHVCLMVMSPTCAWETLWYLGRGKPRMAFRRRGTTTFRPRADLPNMTIHYPSIEALTQAFAPAFEPLYRLPMGLFIPPSELFGMVEKRAWLKRTLLALETRFGSRPRLARWADHYVLMLRRV